MWLNKPVNFIVHGYGYFYEMQCGLVFADKLQSNIIIRPGRPAVHDPRKSADIDPDFGITEQIKRRPGGKS
jgi:hypothetical protein